MKTSRLVSFLAIGGFLVVAAGFAYVADASHAWENYHWARTANPFTLSLGDNMSSVWDPYLVTASSDWSVSGVLDTTVVTGGTNPRTCRATTGRIEVCNAKYGNNGWLGLASIWISGSHITQATAKMNDTYFNTSTYNTPAWRRMVVCQEIAHGFGLAHQDETFNNANLGSCMDYTNDPDGGAGGASATDPSNEHPNQHDYDMLETIYAHLDTTTTIAASVLPSPQGDGREADIGDDPREFGREISRSRDGRASLFELDLGEGNKVFTHVFWAEEQSERSERIDARTER